MILPSTYTDPAAFDVLNQGHFSGVFQFNGQALQRLCRQMKIELLEDMVAITALARPGPMDTGASEQYVRRKIGEEPVKYRHPLLEPILKDTLGILVFQEAAMQICREIGNMDWPEVNAVRRAIGKSKGSDEINKYGKSFKTGALAKGIELAVVDQIWNDILTFGRYGFNKSHAVAYSIVSYHCCWMKAHYPLEFAAATLDAESDPAKQIALLRELADEGVSYTPVDADYSSDRWVPVDGKRLVGPLTQIKGIGPSTVREILDCRKSGKPIRETLRKKLLQARTEIDTLFPIRAALNQACPDLVQAGIVTEPTPIKDVQMDTQGDVVILGIVERMKVVDENDVTRVQRRGKRVTGPSTSLNIFIRDDESEILAKIDRYKFHDLGRRAQEQMKQGKTLVAIKMEPWSFFRGGGVSNFKILGEVE